MKTAESLNDLLLRCQYPYAVYAVTCPICEALAGVSCHSTGGGNFAVVTTHKARTARLAGWSEEQYAAANELVKAQGLCTFGWGIPDGYYAQTEAWAAPIAPKNTKPLTPKGVRLSEIQAERIENAAEYRQGRCSVSTAHFHGDHQDRQTMNSLEAKGIFRCVDPNADHGYARDMVLTAFGWQVYRQHRRIIRRMSDERAAEYEAKARAAEAELVGGAA